MKSFLDPLLRPKAQGPTPNAHDVPSFALTNNRNDRVLATTLLTAFDSASRRRGLLKHDFLPEGSVLIIAPSNAIHTFFMRFAIDVAFVARDGRVLKLRRNMPPWRMAAAVRAFAVIEMPIGALARADTQPGDMLRISDTTAL